MNLANFEHTSPECLIWSLKNFISFKSRLYYRDDQSSTYIIFFIVDCIMKNIIKLKIILHQSIFIVFFLFIYGNFLKNYLLLVILKKNYKI